MFFSYLNVIRLFAFNPIFQTASKIQAEKEEEERKKQNFRENSLAYKFPERVAELWDYEKNGEIKPTNVLGSNTNQFIWLKCPKDGHSWKKKIREIAFFSWERGTSGCPICVGRTKKPEKQPMLTENYFEYVVEYWNFEKNESIGLNPEKLTSGSNYKAWFKCPKDGNEWQAGIVSTVNQQWSKGNTGCRVCNGTHLRKRGVWGKAGKLIEEFPDEVAKYWDYAKNNELKLNPAEITIGSARKAWFKCPIDNHEWQANISMIAGNSWKRGNSGCPQCGRGWTAEAIRQFIASLEEHIPNLTQSERYKIFEQAGILGTTNTENLKIVKDIIKGKLTGQKLREVIQGKQIEKIETSLETDVNLDANSELKIAEIDSIIGNTQNPLRVCLNFSF